MSIIAKNYTIGINSYETHIQNAINDINNHIQSSHKETFNHLYNHFKPIILQGFIGKRLSDIHSIFWQGIIIHMMISLEPMEIAGMIKRDLIVETVCIVIRNDLQINIQDRVTIETQFRKIAYHCIDLLVFASRNLNIKKKKKRFSIF